MYVITGTLKKEPYLSAVFEEVRGGRNLIKIIQNSNVSSEINLDEIKSFLARIQKCDVADLPDLTEFAKTNIVIMPAKGDINDSNSIIELDL